MVPKALLAGTLPALRSDLTNIILLQHSSQARDIILSHLTLADVDNCITILNVHFSNLGKLALLSHMSPGLIGVKALLNC